MQSNESSEHKTQSEPFWDNMTKILLNALFFAVYEGFVENERNMLTVMMLFRWFEVKDDDDREKNPTKLDLFFSEFAKDKEISEKYGDINSNPALRNWEDFRSKCKGKTAQSVTATALAKLAPFDENEIRRIFSKDELELDLVGERKTALFIILPPTNNTYNFIANVVYTQLFKQLEYCATVKHNQELPVPVRFILDEFYNTGKIPNFVHILSYARSFGIGISIILQSLEQLKEMYEKSWATILDNCSTFLYLGGIRNYDTLKYISDLIGPATYDKKTNSKTGGKQSSSSTSFDKFGRQLLDPAEIQRMNKRKCILFVSGYNQYFSKKFNYKKHPNYKFTSDANKKNMFQYELLLEEEDHKKTKNRSKTELIKLEIDSEKVLIGAYSNIDNLYIDEEFKGKEILVNKEEFEKQNKVSEIVQENLDKEQIHIKLTPPIIPVTNGEDVSEIISEFNEKPEQIFIENFNTSLELNDIEIEDFENVFSSIGNFCNEVSNEFEMQIKNLDMSEVPD